ncbi:hypothetical protein C5F49_01005 [Nitrosopumilus oxyclinae]|uniref:Uncharacterized protein n=1 Tax=Nitrosopumilus oxyclinae TaxID=1959104 RepID=A0A7D5M226_9ARCH|nr:lysyl oxidase family protein [Nitrosopumilus oxyclinae]QLH04055.1 hypothetical protein C5F49_01005 [Nitrosopumilus oxyclinae]
MTNTNLVRKSTILPLLLGIGLLSATPFMINASADFLPTVPVPDDAILPDISPGVPKHLNIHNQQQDEYLRFTNVWGNVGVGGLEFEPIIEVPDPVEGTVTQAFQNLYNEEGEFRHSIPPVWNEIVTEFTFHDTHNHWHIDGVGEFAVREITTDTEGNEIPGDIVTLPSGDEAAAIKVGFCISDVYKINGGNPATSQKWYWECEVGFQGIQPGWIDQYHQSTDDNEINITGLPNGEYFLTHTWNPEEFFVDDNDQNDQSWIKFKLSQDNNGNGNRKITEMGSFAPECNPDGSTPGMCGDVSKNS